MDFSKAFDKVSHSRLLYKLEWYGVVGQTHNWVKDFLYKRCQQVVIDGKQSDTSWVTSGVPQGSVLGPLLFLAYINDLPDCVNSQVRLFADDTVVYRKIKNSSDESMLQKDLSNLEKWENTWKMEFHPGKCQVIRITKSLKPKDTAYYLHGHKLEVVSSTKYLGLTIQQDLKWNTHINQVVNKGNRTLGMLKRNLKISSPSIKTMAYRGLVRPQLVYSSTVWDPHHKVHINKVEMVQRRAARWVLNRYHNTSSVSDMLNHLAWPTLDLRRRDTRLCLMYKIVNNLVAVCPAHYLVPVTRPTRHSHPHSFIQLQCKNEAYRSSFFPRTIVQWNLLPTEAVLSPGIEAFKGHLADLGTLQA